MGPSYMQVNISRDITQLGCGDLVILGEMEQVHLLQDNWVCTMITM